VSLRTPHSTAVLWYVLSVCVPVDAPVLCAACPSRTCGRMCSWLTAVLGRSRGNSRCGGRSHREEKKPVDSDSRCSSTAHTVTSTVPPQERQKRAHATDTGARPQEEEELGSPESELAAAQHGLEQRTAQADQERAVERANALARQERLRADQERLRAEVEREQRERLEQPMSLADLFWATLGYRRRH